MEANTRAIIELAWARVLGLPDQALADDDGERITRVEESLAMFVRLWDHRVLLGPDWLLERAAAVPDAELSSGSCLLALGRHRPDAEEDGAPRAVRLLGEAVLAFADAYVEHEGIAEAVVSDERQAVHDLERRCPPDDVTEVGLSAMPQRFVLVDELDAVTAGAGYQEWEGILAHLGVLVPPDLRRSGQGTLAAAIATNDALDSGLVPQWRARRENEASLGVARRLGFRAVGTQTTVLLGATSRA